MTYRRDSLQDLRAEEFNSANASLWLDKYFGQAGIDEDNLKRVFVKQVSEIRVTDVYSAFFQRWSKVLNDGGAESREMSVKGRLTIGLGADSVLETHITLNRTYGTPYIPGSALKGLALRYVRQHLEKKDNNGKDIAEWTREHTRVLFGTTDEAGYVIFFDALYVPDVEHAGVPLHPDVMTVHHPDYYQSTGKAIKPPADWDDPTPIPFLSATGNYLLAVAAPQAQDWRKVTLTILEKALEEEGIGAKTSSGYGFFTQANKTSAELSGHDDLAAKFASKGIRVSNLNR